MAEEDELNEMEAELGNEETPATEPVSAAPEATPVESSPYKVGNRTWKSQDEFHKSYLSLEKEFSRVQNEHKQYEELRKWHSQVVKHPELYDQLNKASADYFKRIQSGQSKATAERATGIPDQVAQELQQLKAFVEETKIERETQKIAQEKADLLKEHPELTPEDIQEILKNAYERGGSALKDSYWIVMGPRSAAKSLTEAERKVAEANKAKRLGSVGPSSGPRVAPTPGKLTEEQENKSILAKLFPEKYGNH